MSEGRKPSPFDPVVATPADQPKPNPIPDARRTLIYPSLSVAPLIPEPGTTRATVPIEKVEVMETPSDVAAIVDKA